MKTFPTWVVVVVGFLVFTAVGPTAHAAESKHARAAWLRNLLAAAAPRRVASLRTAVKPLREAGEFARSLDLCRALEADLGLEPAPSELAELALEDAMAEGGALIEWPERMRSLPEGTLRVHLEIVGDGMRRAEISGPARWAELLGGGLNVERG